MNPNPSTMPQQDGGPWGASRYKFRTAFTYESDITAALNSATSQTLTFNIAGDSDFFWTKFASFALVDSDGTTRTNDQLPGVTILITNTTTGRQYSSSPTPLPNVSGTGPLPFILPMVTLWEAKSTVQIQLANVTDNVNYSQLFLSFIGIKAFF